MGKDRVIKSLGKNIGNLVVHKLLEKYTNKKETLEHLKHETIAYKDNAKDVAEKFNWNEEDKSEIMLEAIHEVEKEMAGDYPDVSYPADEAEKLVEEAIKEIMDEE
jgi:hypothetical protein